MELEIYSNSSSTDPTSLLHCIAMAMAKKRTLPSASSNISNKRRRSVSPHIPYDILLDIFSRLPVRSLIRFKSVHSSWLCLISSYDLCIAHLRLSTRFGQKIGVIQMENTHTKHPSLSLRTLKQISDLDYEVPDLDRVQLQNLLGCLVDHKTNPRFEVYNSCNGLLLTGVGDRNISNFLLWNPCTGGHKNIGRYGTVNLRRYILGIGYESFSDNYKVVLVFQSIRNKKTIAVYNLKTNCWEKKLNCEFPYMMYYAPAGAALSNDRPHWQVEKLVDNQNINAIICFSLAEDKVKDVKLLFVAKRGDSVYLSSFQGFLCVGHFDRSEMSEPCIWIEKEKSWIKWFKCFPKYLQSYQYLMPVESMNKGDIVMSLDRKAIALYYQSTRDCEIVLLSGYGNGSRVAVYAETLVSPHHYFSRQRK